MKKIYDVKMPKWMNELTREEIFIHGFEEGYNVKEYEEEEEKPRIISPTFKFMREKNKVIKDKLMTNNI
jgi:hypothetical protein